MWIHVLNISWWTLSALECLIVCFDILVHRFILNGRLFGYLSHLLSLSLSISLFLVPDSSLSGGMLWLVGYFFLDFQVPSQELGLTMSLWSSSQWCVGISLIQSPEQCWFSSLGWGGGLVLNHQRLSPKQQSAANFWFSFLSWLGMFYPSFLPQAMRWALFLNP